MTVEPRPLTEEQRSALRLQLNIAATIAPPYDLTDPVHAMAFMMTGVRPVYAALLHAENEVKALREMAE